MLACNKVYQNRNFMVTLVVAMTLQFNLISIALFDMFILWCYIDQVRKPLSLSNKTEHFVFHVFVC